MNIIFTILILTQLIFPQNIQYFDGDRAMAYLNQQCAMGPRYPGSVGHDKSIHYFIDFFKRHGDQFLSMKETILHPYDAPDSLRLTNFMVRFNMDAQKRIMLMAHWDTRKVADMDENKENQNTPIIGANDGASGVAVLMVISEMLHHLPLLNLGVDILLVDGEDVGHSGDSQNFGIGTRLFSRHIPEPKPEVAICIDMVGDKELTLPIEQFSYIQAPDFVMDIWNFANQLGYTQFQKTMGIPITDDHRVLFVHSGIPAIDIIDFNYPNTKTNYWHTVEDTPDKCSAESLAVVGTVVLNYLYQLDGAMK
jgi:hypothetical protein